ncbi:hypothetical protein [Natrononativus amylolyticus]|uniref:hypothetical protein n=1 Tax=Natrononativus amylolyticus TaxID=2963434 RepID=UPI0020CD14F7|nr:hypothetical protein [Natrononativus amylolyticus]
MNRRTLLERLAAITAVGALAGCLDEGGDPGDGGDPEDDGADDDESDEPGDDTDDEPGDDTGDEDDTDDETDDTGEDDADDDGSGEISDQQITTTDADCTNGNGGDDATVSVEAEVVEITGSLGAPDPCHEAAFGDVVLEDGELTVEITAEPGDDACQQCLATLEYEATVEFDGDAPDHVAVRHDDDGETTTVAETDGDE